MTPPRSIEEKAREQFDRQSDHYGKSHVLAQTDDLRSVLSVLSPQAGQRLLDIATGAGHTAVYFARLGLHVTASDISENMLQKTNQLAKEAGVDLEINQHPAEKLPYPDGSFDLVTCRVAAHHFSCPASFSMEVSRVLRPGGHFLLIDGTVEDGYPEAEAWAHDVETLRDPSHNQLVTPDKWSHLIGHVAMKVVHRELLPLKQPDLEWYFETAATPPENQKKVRELVANPPKEAKQLFKIAHEDGKWVWWWQRLILAARKLS
ncbi:MAG: class I SAM-dependent methyltransferase [Verrucomicrobiota bacterium]